MFLLLILQPENRRLSIFHKYTLPLFLPPISNGLIQYEELTSIMIREFLKINDKDYVMSDEKGNMRVICLGDDSMIEDIVTKENELEYYQKSLSKCDDIIKLFFTVF